MKFRPTLSRGAIESIEAMIGATNRMSDGDFSVRVDEGRQDELGRLGSAINHMSGRLEGYVKGQRRFLSAIAHELSSPIARIQLALGILEEDVSEKGGPRVERALKEVAKLSELVNEILAFRNADVDARPMDLQRVSLRGVVAAAMDGERKEDSHLINDVPESLTGKGVPQLLVRAMSNILRNAVRYARDAGPIRVVGKAKGDRVLVEVRDRGPGVSEDALSDLFRPFFREDPSRNHDTGGVGLGLAIVQNCMQACGGQVVARNRKSGGFAVSIILERG